MASEATLRGLKPYLFSDPALGAFAVIDCAASPRLHETLADMAPPQICLPPGELSAARRAASPHLVALLPEAPFTDWLLNEGWGKSWGILGRSAAGLRALRGHFRELMVTRLASGELMLFRFYDPRVLRQHLPGCEPAALDGLFGPVEEFIIEQDGAGALLFARAEGQLVASPLPLGPQGRRGEGTG